nr:E-selectin isoform X1 [Crassostrea gigas]
MQHLRIILIFEIIVLLRHLCIAILCPMPVKNAVLSSTCSRKIGEPCSFSCTQGHPSTTMDTIVCTSDGTWDLNPTTLCSHELGPFLSKEKAALYLKVRSKRVKRDINEECAEGPGCTYEEITEIGVTDVCAWMKNRLCSQLKCGAGYICVTTVNNCGALNNYRVACQEIFCPMPVGNAVLSSTCSRKIGVSCSFSCTQGHLSTTLDNIVCTSDGNWDLNTTTLCSPIVCPKSVGNAVISPNCSRMIGKSCTYSCTHGYFPTTSDSVVCTSEGSWKMDNDTLCSLIHCPLDVINGNISSSCRGLIGEKCYMICDNSVYNVNIVCLSSGSWDKDTTAICSLKNESVIHCPLDVINGNISSSCRGLIGEKCYIICDNSVNTVNIVCLSSGSWDKDTTAICSLKNESVIHCPLDDVINGNISSSCRGLIGEKCYIICDNSVNTVNIVCLSSGSWDKDTTAICSLKNESESSSLKASRPNMTFLVAGISVAGTLFVVIIVGVTCLIKRRNEQTKNINQGMPLNTENRTYFGSVNSAYEEPIQRVYSEI